MYDRIVRAEIFLSDRWLDLPTDTARLVFMALIHQVDDFGNFEGGSRRLFRFMHQFAQVKTEADAVKIMNDLSEADLVRGYRVKDVDLDYWHMPRFRNDRRYTTRRCPRSPWCDAMQLSTVEKMRLQNNTHVTKPAAALPQPSGRPSADLPRGVGVGVGVGVGRKATPELLINPKSTADAIDDKSLFQNNSGKPKTKDELIEAEGKSLGVLIEHGETWPDYVRRVERCRLGS